MTNAMKFSTFAIFLTLFITGCGSSNKNETNSTKVHSSCATNTVSTLNTTALTVMHNSLQTSTHILKDMNQTLVRMDTMNDRVLKTVELSAKTVSKLADDFNMTEEGAKHFKVGTILPGFVIKGALSKKYILASSASRFFPDAKTLKTLFYDSNSLTIALNRAIDTADKSNNLYMTILQIETNGTITNLTNGLLILKSNL